MFLFQQNIVGLYIIISYYDMDLSYISIKYIIKEVTESNGGCSELELKVMEALSFGPFFQPNTDDIMLSFGIIIFGLVFLILFISRNLRARMKSSTRTSYLKKQITLNEPKNEEWCLPYLIVLCFLGIVKKGLANIKDQIKNKQQKQNNEQLVLRKLYYKDTNFFDFIEPTRRHILKLQKGHEILKQIKKEVIKYLIKIKQKSSKQEIQIQRKPVTVTDLPQSEQPKDASQTEVVNIFETTFLDDSFSLRSQKQMNAIKEKESSHIQKLSPLKNTYRNTYRPNKPLSTNRQKNRAFMISLKRLTKKMQQECSLFQNLNKSLATFCQAPNQKTSSNRLIQLFEYFSQSLTQTKDEAEILQFMMFTNQQCRERVEYLIGKLTETMGTLCQQCLSLCQFNKNIKSRMQDVLHHHSLSSNLESKGKAFSDDSLVSKFIKRLGIMMEITKITISMPGLGCVKTKQKNKPNIVTKLSEFRYLAGCLHSQVKLAKVGKKLNQLKDKKSFEYQWKKIVDSKFGRMKTSRY